MHRIYDKTDLLIKPMIEDAADHGCVDHKVTRTLLANSIILIDLSDIEKELERLQNDLEKADEINGELMRKITDNLPGAVRKGSL